MENDIRILEPSLYVVKALIILDGDGSRLIAKYYDDTFANVKEQKTFERNLFAKTSKGSVGGRFMMNFDGKTKAAEGLRENGEIILIDGLTCVYKSNVDLYFYIAGSSHENELMLTAVLNCLYESAQKVLGKSFEKRTFMDNLDSMFLVVDEIVDGGIICEIDSDAVTQRAAIRSEEQLPLGEQTVAQVLQTAKEQLRWSLLK